MKILQLPYKNLFNVCSPLSLENVSYLKTPFLQIKLIIVVMSTLQVMFFAAHFRIF